MGLVCNSSHPPVRPASGQGRRHEVKSFFFFFFVPFKTIKEKHITRGDGQGSTHVLGFRRTCCYGNAGCSSPCRATWPGMRGRASRQLLRLQCLLGLLWKHMCGGAGAGGPPTFHAGTTFHKSTSSSPTGAGSGPRRLSSLPCFLLTEQKTSVKAWRNHGRALTIAHHGTPTAQACCLAPPAKRSRHLPLIT